MHLSYTTIPVTFLDKKDKRTLTKTIQDVPYTFHILTVASETEMIDYLKHSRLRARKGSFFKRRLLGLSYSFPNLGHPE